MNINTINIESITQKPHDPTRITATRKRNFAPFGQNKKPSKKQKIEHSSMNQTAAVEQINEKIYTELDHLIKLQNEKYSEDRSSKLKDITSKIIELGSYANECYMKNSSIYNQTNVAIFRCLPHDSRREIYRSSSLSSLITLSHVSRCFRDELNQEPRYLAARLLKKSKVILHDHSSKMTPSTRAEYRVRDEAFEVLSFVEVIAEDADIAIKTLLEVKWDVDETNNNSFLKIATKLEKRKDFTGAAKRFRHISPTTPTINAELLDQTKETLSSGERLKDSQTAKELMKHGYKQQRTATLGKLQLIANRITDPSLKAKIQVNIGDIRGAISTANQVKNTKYQYPLVLAQIAKALLGKPFYEKLPEGVDLLLK